MKYIANPVEVDAFKITNVATPFDQEGRSLTLEGRELPVRATAEMCSRMTPNVGDYWVIQSDGYIYLNPKDVFERKYRPISGAPELNALELGAAVRRAGLAGQ